MYDIQGEVRGHDLHENCNNVYIHFHLHFVVARGFSIDENGNNNYSLTGQNS